MSFAAAAVAAGGAALVAGPPQPVRTGESERGEQEPEQGLQDPGHKFLH